MPPGPTPGGTIRAVKLLKALAGAGWDVDCITSCMPKGGAHYSESLLNEIPPQIRLHRVGYALGAGAVTGHSGEGCAVRIKSAVLEWLRNYVIVPDRAIGWVPVALCAALRIIGRKLPQVLFVSAPPHSGLIAAAILKDITGLPLAVDLRDDWIGPVFPYYGGKGTWGPAIQDIMQRYVFARSDRIFTVTESSRSFIASRYPAVAHKVAHIPNGVDMAEIPAHDKLPSMDSRRFIMTHGGSLAAARRIDGLLDAVSMLARREKAFAETFRLRFVGLLDDKIKRKIEEFPFREIIEMLPHCDSRAEYWKLLAESALLLVVPDGDRLTQLPGKIYEYWAMGRAPVLALASRGETRRFVLENGLGDCADPTDAKRIAKLLATYLRAWLAGRPRTVSSVGIQRFDRSRIAESMNSELLVLARKRQRGVISLRR